MLPKQLALEHRRRADDEVEEELDEPVATDRIFTRAAARGIRRRDRRSPGGRLVFVSGMTCDRPPPDVYRGGVQTQVVVLNGGSSSGKSSIARCLQSTLQEPWLTLGVDTLIQAMPLSMHGSDSGIQFGAAGQVIVGDAFRKLEAAWYRGLASIVRAGAGVIVDEVFLGGAASQERLRVALDGLRVLWVGVHCDAAIAAAREATRDDRKDRRGDVHPGTAESQADVVHHGVRYDFELDTTATAAMDCARAVAQHVIGPGTIQRKPVGDDTQPGG